MSALFAVLLAPSFASAADKYAVQVGSFSQGAYADNVVSDLGKKGVKCRSSKVGNLYKVFCGEFDQPEGAAPMKSKLESLGYWGAFSAKVPASAAAPALKTPSVVAPIAPALKAPAVMAPMAPALKAPAAMAPKVPAAATPRAPAAPAASPAPAPGMMTEREFFETPTPQAPAMAAPRQPQGGVTGDVFAKGSGVLHPFVSLRERYTDNYADLEDSQKDSDIITSLNGGLWLQLPGQTGAADQRFEDETSQDMSLYAKYEVEKQSYSTYSERDITNQYLNSYFNLKLGSAFGLKVSDDFNIAYDSRQDDQFNQNDLEYKSNEPGAELKFETSSDSDVTLSFSKLDTNYVHPAADDLDRVDTSSSIKVSFEVMPKTRLNLRYRIKDIDYRLDPTANTAASNLDAKETDFMVGAAWDMTGKTTGTISAGFSKREFDQYVENTVANTYSIVESSSSGLKMTGQARYVVSPKTTLRLTVDKSRKESDIHTVDFIDNTSFTANMDFNMTPRVTVTTGLTQTGEVYEGITSTVDQVTGNKIAGERVDNTTRFNLDLKYRYPRWLETSLLYKFATRDSNFYIYDFTTNSIAIKLSANF